MGPSEKALKRAAKRLVKSFLEGKLLATKETAAELEKRMLDTLRANFKEEAAIQRDAERILEENKRQTARYGPKNSAPEDQGEARSRARLRALRKSSWHAFPMIVSLIWRAKSSRRPAAAGEILDERRALAEAKRVLAECFQLEDRLDPVVRSRIPRRVMPGTAEWEILYRRYMDEEIRKVQGG